MNYTLILFGAGGALAVNLLNFLEAINVPKDRRPDFRDIVTWIPLFINPLLGGFISWAYIASGYDIKPLLAIQLGASSPLFLRAAASIIPKELSSKNLPPEA